MCGIFGVVEKKIDRELALHCTNTLEHRGPDGGDVWQADSVTLGHRRLAILDLSSNGKQPMAYANERYWLTFNGEIYNFIEIRNELLLKGYKFHGESDSEVILAAFCEWREKCLDKFNGMWAFAIWDNVKQELFLSRDRFGVKPLFYSFFKDGGMAFASEMKAIMPLFEKTQVNYELFDYYNFNRHYETREDCLIKEIKRFPAGSYAWIKNGDIKIIKWWNTLDHLVSVPKDYDEQVEAFRALFLDSCKIRMRSDVTIGTALSGGLDSSSTICAMAYLNKNCKEERMNQDWQHAFVAGFPNTSFDETKYAQQVTDYLHIGHSFLDISNPISENSFLKQIYLFEELWENPQIPMMEIYKKERQAGTRVSIDGHGADELFAGYEFDVIKAFQVAKGNKKSIVSIARAVFEINESKIKEREFEYLKYKWYYSEMIKYYGKRILGREEVKSSYSGHKQWNELDILNKTLFKSTHETILPTMLRNYDRDSMANGVEIRMPFMDYRIVEFAFSIDWTSKVRNTYTKSIIRDAVSPFVPHSIAYRHSKIGFNAPAVEWMKGIYKDFYLDTVNSAEFANCALIKNAGEVRKNLDHVICDNNVTFSEATRVWNQIQPFLWEKAFLKREW